MRKVSIEDLEQGRYYTIKRREGNSTEKKAKFIGLTKSRNAKLHAMFNDLSTEKNTKTQATYAGDKWDFYSDSHDPNRMNEGQGGGSRRARPRTKQTRRKSLKLHR